VTVHGDGCMHFYGTVTVPRGVHVYSCCACDPQEWWVKRLLV